VGAGAIARAAGLCELRRAVVFRDEIRDAFFAEGVFRFGILRADAFTPTFFFVFFAMRHSSVTVSGMSANPWETPALVPASRRARDIGSVGR
jgi:hypothetical protein